jgi:hypothetical protein
MYKLFIISSFILALASCGVTSQDAVHYNNRIIALDSAVTISLDSVLTAVDSLNSEDYNVLYNEFIINLQSSVIQLDSLASFYGDNELYQATKKLFVSYYDIAQTKRVKLREIAEMPDSAYTSETDSTWQYLNYQVEKQLKYNIDSFMQVQVEFAKRYKIEIKK